MTGQANEREPRAGARQARSEQYLDNDLKGQRRWYSTRASAYKTRAQACSFAVIVAGAATSFLQVLPAGWLPASPANWVPVATAAFGALVVLLEGWQRISRYNETWPSYRAASERMKREQRLYVNGAGAYRGTEEEEAYLRFVEAVEAIIAEEQKLYWQGRPDEVSTKTPPNPA
ncbi:DUF4231 domain-containing protein [Methylobacterium sp. SyP6R]|uniref:DUF4231 domain-containing protein n=1 Tax=Methylobacterium sp. SyP6R TaxID=2718876 RepID=UPI001F27EC6F|nr:DUF4231 domain-containing protein [Methylobacterium sp. SyP6R]MCF4130279.1 DUF4231 domain-containing protein [Methylobacterium sp. SyP6R]